MKTWQGDPWPGDKEVVVGLYQSVDGSEPTKVLKDGTPLTVTLTKDMPYNNTAFTNLYSRDTKSGKNISYSIREESIGGVAPLEAGYIQEYGISNGGVYIVRNKPATTLTVKKEWYDFQENKVEDYRLAAQSSVTFDVYRSTTPFADPTPDDGITNADMTAFAATLVKVRDGLSFGASDGWSMEINDLDKQDDEGNPYYYYALETVPSFGNELYVVNETDRTVLIKNKVSPEIAKLTVTKAALVDDPRTESLDRDFGFTLKLYVDDTHPVRSWQVYTDTADPENNLVTDWNGEAKFTLKPTDPDKQTTPGASITLDLPKGVHAKVTEAYNPEYTVDTQTAASGTKGDFNRSFTYEVNDAAVTLTYTNTLHVVCKVVKADEALPAEERHVPFESLKSALKYIRDNKGSFTSLWTIYML